MLDPDHRALYTDALRPPPGFQFEEAVATTYSLDLQTLLTVPLQLALFSAAGSQEELLEDGVALLEALRQTTGRMTVYTQTSRILAPPQPQVLFSLLEPTVVEVAAPSETGVFHPKIWFLRFRSPDSGSERVRLLVTSRNITDDRSWDLALSLEGRPGKDPLQANEPLAAFLERLPGLAVGGVASPVDGEGRVALALADLARRTVWELPDGFSELRFHALGLDERTSWSPGVSRRMAVISPFVSEAALNMLLRESRDPVALVSRGEELATIDRGVRKRFERVLTLAEQAEREDGEELARRSDPLHPGQGLHAKAYICERDWRTHVYVGSANATNAALVRGANVELMVELEGLRSRVGGIEDLLGDDGLGSILLDHPLDGEMVDAPGDGATDTAEVVRRELARAEISLSFSKREDGHWGIVLTASRRPRMEGVAALRAWLVSRGDGTAVDALPLIQGAAVELPPAALAHLTSFIAFEVLPADAEESARFVLSAGAPDLPVEERDAAILHDVIRNRKGFLRYVMLLLAAVGRDGPVFGRRGMVRAWGKKAGEGDELLPLFEHMTRALCRQPGRLASVESLLAEMGLDRRQGGARGDEEVVVPAKFLELWEVFRDAMAHDDGGAP